MFQIDPLSRTPVYEQIIEQAQKLISAGILAPGDKMPSVRSLSISLSVNPNTIQRSYGMLDTMGLIVSVPGKGCFVSDSAADVIFAKNKKRLSEISNLAAELHSAGINSESILDAVREGISSAEGQGHDTERKNSND